MTVQPDPLFWPDMRLLAVFLAAVLVGEVIWRLTVGRLPEQRPGDAGDLALHLGCVLVVGVLVVGMACAAGLYVLMGMSQLRGIP